VFTVSMTVVVVSGHNYSKVSDRSHLCNSLLLTLISNVLVSVCVCMYVRT
jgi:hypothetical protein